MNAPGERLSFALAAGFSLLLAGLALPSGASAYESSHPAPERIESLCRPWTESACIAKVGGSLRSARSGNPLAGKKLRFVSAGKVICTSMTDGTGHASCLGVVPSGKGLAESGYEIRFEGDDRFIAGSAQGRASARAARLARTAATRAVR